MSITTVDIAQVSRVTGIAPVVIKRLWRLAIRARDRAYAPYSRFRVGAALLDESGRVFTGANVENASYGLSICAERSAVFAAVSRGCTKPLAVVLVTTSYSPVMPCGACRQVLAEFGDPWVISFGAAGDAQVVRVSDLLPASFSAEDMAKIDGGAAAVEGLE